MKQEGKPHSRFGRARKWLIFWTLFIGLGAVGGAAMMLLAPSGRSVGMDGLLPYFQVLPFADVLFQDLTFSGFALLLVNGLMNLTAAGLLLALHYTCWMTSLSFASTFVSTALVCTQPLFVAALSGVLLHEPIKREAVPGAVVAVVGAAAIGLLSMGGESGSLLGDALALIGAAFIAGHWLTSRAARRNLPALGFMTFVYGVTAVFLLLISPFAGGLAVTGESLYGIIVLAVACTLGGHALMTYLLGFVSSVVVSFALLAEPIGAAVWALLLFHEKVTPPLMIGGLTVIVGLMLYTYGEMKAGKR